MSEQVARKLEIKQICFIDDSKTSTFVTMKLLNHYGYQVDHFNNAESALEALLEFDYSLLITDIMISSKGGVNGDDLIRLIRQSGHPKKSQIPILVVTGSSDLSTHNDLLHVGADRVLDKPLNARVLQKTISELVPQLSPQAEKEQTPDVEAVETQNSEEIPVFNNLPMEKTETGNTGITFHLDDNEELQTLGESFDASELSTFDIAIEKKHQGKSLTSSKYQSVENLSVDELLGFQKTEIRQNNKTTDRHKPFVENEHSRTDFATISDVSDNEGIQSVILPELQDKELEFDEWLERVENASPKSAFSTSDNESVSDLDKSVPAGRKNDNVNPKFTHGFQKIHSKNMKTDLESGSAPEKALSTDELLKQLLDNLEQRPVEQATTSLSHRQEKTPDTSGPDADPLKIHSQDNIDTKEIIEVYWDEPGRDSLFSGNWLKILFWSVVIICLTGLSAYFWPH